GRIGKRAMRSARRSEPANYEPSRRRSAHDESADERVVAGADLHAGGELNEAARSGDDVDGELLRNHRAVEIGRSHGNMSGADLFSAHKQLRAAYNHVDRSRV